jgi:hypothetical protein
VLEAHGAKRSRDLCVFIGARTVHPHAGEPGRSC